MTCLDKKIAIDNFLEGISNN